MAEQKTKETDASVDDFLKSIEDAQRREDAIAITKLFEQASKLKPKMWGNIIGFGSYHYKYASGHEGDSMLVGFAPRKQNFALYISTGFETRDALLEKLGKYKSAKACLYINRLADVDPKVLKELVKQSVEYRKKNS